MDGAGIIIIIAVMLVFSSIGGLAYLWFARSRATNVPLRDLMVSRNQAQALSKPSRAPGVPRDPEAIKEITGSAKPRIKEEDLSTKLFRAGYFSAADRQKFLRSRIVLFSVSVIFLPLGAYSAFGKFELVALGVILGAIIGYALPMTMLERQIRTRQEDILYYLPLAIEQVSIGVSSALDIGPCLAHITQLAYERSSHNPVTEMFVHVEKLIRSGLNLEDALVEVGSASGIPEVKHAFMFLAQCARHGGEVTKQLQELADSVMMQRQVAIEGKIAALPVKATGPLTMVFAGYFALLFAGLIVRLLSAFGGGS